MTGTTRNRQGAYLGWFITEWPKEPDVTDGMSFTQLQERSEAINKLADEARATGYPENATFGYL